MKSDCATLEELENSRLVVVNAWRRSFRRASGIRWHCAIEELFLKKNFKSVSLAKIAPACMPARQKTPPIQMYMQR